MFGTVYRVERYTMTLLINDCCSTKLQKVYLNKLESSPVGTMVIYEVEYAVGMGKLPKLKEIFPCDFDSCSRCGKSQDMMESQMVRFLQPKLRNSLNFTSLLIYSNIAIIIYSSLVD